MGLAAKDTVWNGGWVWFIGNRKETATKEGATGMQWKGIRGVWQRI